MSCGSLPCVGGQNEIVGVPGRPESVGPWQRLRVSGRRTEQDYWLCGEHPILLAALRRRPRGLRVVDGSGGALFRLSGGDALQYDANPWFRPDGGTACACASGCGGASAVPGSCSTPDTAPAGSAARGSTPSP